MYRELSMRAVVSCALFTIAATSVASAGSLMPPVGPVAPTPGPEPRVAINLINTPGDANSVYKITQPGSYYLAGNLSAPAGMACIEIDADDVAIDLNGFSLVGVSGSLSGVADRTTDLVPPVLNMTVHNGTITGFGRGMDLNESRNVKIDSIIFHGNSNGIEVGSGCVVTNCMFREATGYGIFSQGGALVSQCIAFDTDIGFSVDDGVVVDCVAKSNRIGFAGSSTSFTHCAAISNSEIGVDLGTNSVLRDCTVETTKVGVAINGRSTQVLDCSISTCTSAGIRMTGLGSDSRLVGNTLSDIVNGSNPLVTAIVVGAGSNRVLIERNTVTQMYGALQVSGSSCVIVGNRFGNSLSPSNFVMITIAPGNRFGPFVKAGSNGSLLSLTTAAASAPGSVSTTDPNANLFW